MSFFDKTLWLGLAWVALLGVALSLTSTGGLGPAGWVALLLAGVGWQAIAVFFGGTGKQAAVDQQRMKGEEQALLDEFHLLLEECSTRFSAQLELARGELGRVQSLLAEAITGLTESFHNMHEHTRHQREVSVAVTSGASDDGSASRFDDFVRDTTAVMQQVVDSIVGNSKLGMELVETLRPMLIKSARD